METRADVNNLPPLSYIPGLDGIRAIAIALVLFSHSVIHDQFVHLQAVGRGAGQAGVAVFFVLSGYLITTILLREEDRTGDIALRSFYLRRAFRLFPALWLYLFTAAFIKLCGGMHTHPSFSFVYSFFYIRNLIGKGHETAHLWSLSLEEQFYLLWPLILVALSKQNRARLFVAALLLAAVTIWRIYAAHHDLASEEALYIRSDFRLDAPLFGCVLALAKRVIPSAVQKLHSDGLRSSVLAIASVAGLALWIGLTLGEKVYAGLNDTAVCFLGVLLVLSQIGVQNQGSRWLAWRPLRMIGQISYGLYLWQMLFTGPRVPGWSGIRTFPIGLCLTFVVATISYWGLERPILRLKDQKLHRPSDGAPHLPMAANA